MTAFEYTGGSLFGYQKDTSVDEFDRRQSLRKAFQTPGEQTVAELGEGRGMSLHVCSMLYTGTNYAFQVSTALATRSDAQSASRRLTVLRFPHPRSLRHKLAFFSIRLSPLLCVNYPPISRCLLRMPDTSIRLGFLLSSGNFKQYTSSN
jgi:hypothetical protein